MRRGLNGLHYDGIFCDEVAGVGISRLGCWSIACLRTTSDSDELRND